MVKDAGKKFKWFIIGDGGLHDKLQSMIDEKKLNDYFYLLGPRDNPYPYIKNCDIFVQPSRYEGKSVVLDEAKIIGAPIIVTKYPTVFDQIEDGKEGYIVEINSKAIAEGVIDLIDNKEKRDEISNYLLAHEYGNQSEIEKYIKVIDE